jgi:hypothetical protein
MVAKKSFEPTAALSHYDNMIFQYQGVSVRVSFQKKTLDFEFFNHGSSSSSFYPKIMTLETVVYQGTRYWVIKYRISPTILAEADSSELQTLFHFILKMKPND